MCDLFFHFSSVPLRAAVTTTVFSVIVHIPLYLRYTRVDGVIKNTRFSYSDENLYYMMTLFVVTRVIPIIVLLITNILLLKSVDHAIKKRAALAFERINIAEVRAQGGI